MSRIPTIALASLLTLAFSSVPAWAAYLASDVLGQTQGDLETPAYTSGTYNGTGNAAGFPFTGTRQVAVDTVNHRLFTTDGGGRRVLVFNLDTSNNLEDSVADYILGGSDFRTPFTGVSSVSLSSSVMGLAYDAADDRLFVADDGNNRVMVFDTETITNGEPAVNVLGQSSFTTSTTMTNQMSTPAPNGLAYDPDTKYLYVTQISSARRLTVFDLSGGITNGASASFVLGITDFTSTGFATGQNRFTVPRGVAIDSANDRLFVVDDNTKRVMIFNVASISNGENAVNVLFQQNYTAAVFGATATRSQQPLGVAYNSAQNRLYVSDGGNSRIAVFDTASITDGEPMVAVLGQSLFTTGTGAATQAGLRFPHGVAVDSTTGKLWVADQQNLRFIQYDINSVTNGENAVDMIGHINTDGSRMYTAWHPVNGLGFRFPDSLAIDHEHHRLFTCENVTGGRVVMYELDSSDDLLDNLADAVLGQPHIATESEGLTQSRMGQCHGVAYDADNDRLFAADFTNNRVLVWDTASITDGENAVAVIGQPNFTTGSGTATRAKLNRPRGIAYDSVNQRLFVAEINNNRVTVHDVSSLSNGASASFVLGQTGFTGANVATTRTGMSNPVDVAYDEENERLFVAQSGNHRVTVYDLSGGITNGASASFVLGQSDFTTDTSGTTQAKLSSPLGLAYDSENQRLYVAESGNDRVGVFDVASISDGESMVAVYGKDDFTTTGTGTTQALFSEPYGVTFDSGNNRLYVADNSNSRYMMFDHLELPELTLAAAKEGDSYSQSLNETGEQGSVTFSLVSGTLPPGLTLGSLTGTPTEAGTYTFTLQATDTVGSAGDFLSNQRTYTMTVGEDSPNTGGYWVGATPSPTGGTASACSLASVGLREGQTIAAYESDDPDVYIVNDWCYKRLFLNPAIFGLYDHLVGGFGDVTVVTPETRDRFTTSGLYRNCETGDARVWGISVSAEDIGTLHELRISGDEAARQDPDFFRKVFCINSLEQALYPVGEPWTSVSQVPEYSRW